jgi:hypothetical protein
LVSFKTEFDSPLQLKEMHMGKIEKKKKRLMERIQHLEEEMQNSLVQKTSNVREIDVAEYSRRIAELRKELSQLK